MPRRSRIRDRILWSHWGCSRMPYHFWGPWGPPPWWGERLTKEEEKECLEEHIAFLKQELNSAEQELSEISKKD